MKKKSNTNKIQPGQRWMSEMEPELGMGIVKNVERRFVGLSFPATDVFRTYAIASAPIRRVRFKIGDRVHLQDETTFIVKDIIEENHLLSYSDGEQYFLETDISHMLVLNTPEEKMSAGQIDHMQTYLLRVETFKQRNRWKKSECFGFVGGCIDLLPHQLYIANEVTKRQLPRVLLADEVGLGKTIEACLIIHRLILSGRINRVLILVPQVLIYQWFVEFFKRFHILFRVADDLFFQSIEKQSKEANPFSEAQLIISSTESISENPKRKQQMIDADWDLLVIDEAHHLQKESPLYEAIKVLSQNIHGLLLLSATPEQLGLKNHFERLSLLDPDRYYDYDSFLDETLNYQKIARLVDELEKRNENDPDTIQKVKTELQNLKGYNSEDVLKKINKDKSNIIRNILDTHGTGRVMFRNTRSVVKGFPERKVHLIPLENTQNETVLTQLDMELLLDLGLSDQKPIFQLEKDPRILWLTDFLKTNKDEKCLIICCYPEKVIAVHKAIQKHINVQISLFHEKVPLKQRDENAAWFAEKSGAQILICSEMGSEGRNFQFVNNLILFDLPKSPELLEQRIGRLDRIGQKKTIHIHLPFSKNSPQSMLIKWYQDGLNAFTRIIPYAQTIYELSKQKLIHMLLDPPDNKSEFEQFISETQKLCLKLAKEFDAGRDRLLERNSYNKKIALKIQEDIKQEDCNLEIENYTQQLFGHFGVVFKEYRPRTYKLKLNHNFNDKFSGVHKNGMPVTFDRKKALMLENITFLSWDHPLINDAMELLIGEGDGQCSFAVWEDFKNKAIYLESLYILECIAPQNLHLDRFLPSTPIQMLVDDNLKNCQKLLQSKDFESNLADARPRSDLFNDAIVKIPDMIKYSKKCVKRLANKIITDTLKEIDIQMDNEINRLNTLKAINPNVKDFEIKAAKLEKKSLKEYVSSARIRIDAIRLIRRG